VSSGTSITQELGLGDVISRTFELYRRNFAKYFVLFVVVEAIIGVVSTLARGAFPLPTLPANPTNQQVIDWAPGFFGTLVVYVGIIGIVSLVVGTIAAAGTIRMASEEIEGRPIGLGEAVSFAVRKMVWVWVLGLVVGIIVGLGLIALVVPGIILAIMFSMALPSLLIENTGILGSMSRSRELVGHRWGKTFATFLVLGIIVVVIAIVLSLVAAAFGSASTLVSDVLSAFYQPILPVASVVYFYSNRARITPTQAGMGVGQGPVGPTAMPALGMKFCPNCGTQLVSSATFCSMCGAKQPVQT